MYASIQPIYTGTAAITGRLKAWGLHIPYRGLDPVIPPRANRKNPSPRDFKVYNDRHRIERIFNRLKQFRRAAMSFDKTAKSFAAFLALAPANYGCQTLSTGPRFRRASFLYATNTFSPRLGPSPAADGSTASRSAFSSPFRPIVRTAVAADFRARRTRQQPDQTGLTRTRSSNDFRVTPTAKVASVYVISRLRSKAYIGRSERIHGCESTSGVRIFYFMKKNRTAHLFLKCLIMLPYRSLCRSVPNRRLGWKHCWGTVLPLRSAIEPAV